MTKFFLAAAACLVLSTQAHANINYQCPNAEGLIITVTIFDEEGIAVAFWNTTVGGAMAETVMRDQSAGNSFSYSNETATFGGTDLLPATLSFNNGFATTCNVTTIEVPGGGTITQ